MRECIAQTLTTAGARVLLFKSEPELIQALLAKRTTL
jgi:hypothetical protein